MCRSINYSINLIVARVADVASGQRRSHTLPCAHRLGGGARPRDRVEHVGSEQPCHVGAEVPEARERGDGHPRGRCERVVTTGLKWNLDGERPLEFGSLISSSNELVEPLITVETDSPLLWTTGLKDL